MTHASTTARGYGYPHRQARKQALAAHRDGDPCPRCGYPMYRTQALDLDHTDDRDGYLGLSHASPCNRGAGGRKARANDRARLAGTTTTPRRSRTW